MTTASSSSHRACRTAVLTALRARMRLSRRTRRTLRYATRVAARLARVVWTWLQWVGIAIMAGIIAAMLTACGGGDQGEDDEAAAAVGDQQQLDTRAAIVCLQKPGHAGWPQQQASCPAKGK